jgi:STE24 endopeptidase
MTWNLFWSDLLKQVVLALVLGIPLLYALFFFMAKAGPNWWLWAFGLILVFQIIMVGVYPIFIAPFFNRFRPLPEGELKASLLTMARRLRFPAADIFVMDGSVRSLHANAYFMGIGKWRRIVLYDTLLHQMENRELLSVVAHEIGHYKHKHIFQQIFLQALFMGLSLYLAAFALQFAPLFGAFGFAENAGQAMGIFLFLTCLSSLSLWLKPIQNLISRNFEYVADAYAVKACQDPEAMGQALIKLAGKNLSNMTPHPWYSAFYYSHPKLEDRLKAL